MPALRLTTGGESHGKAITAILEGFPAGLAIDLTAVNTELRKRQQGYGRSGRQRIESDEVEVTGGLRHGITTGAPLVLTIANRDHPNWTHVMNLQGPDLSDEAVLKQLAAKKIDRFRPGHADYAGTLKYGHQDVRDVLERASARETAARVAAGAFARLLLEALDIEAAAHVIAIGSVASSLDSSDLSVKEITGRIADSDVFCADAASAEAMRAAIKQALLDGDSLGGRVEVLVDNLPVGLGSYTQWDRKLDGQIAQALISIQAFKAVEFGDGVVGATRAGTNVHDAIYAAETDKENLSALPVSRQTNHAGGIEGGMTNGERLLVRAYMKPIPTVKAGLPSVSYPGFATSRAHYERSDVCAVPAASVVAKAMVCLTLANSIIDKFAGDSMRELSASLSEYRRYCQNLSSHREGN